MDTTKKDQIRRFRDGLRILERETVRPFDDRSRCCGLTLAQGHALVEIGRGGEVSLVDLAASFGLDTSTLSRTIQDLVLAGLVDRRAGLKDRRYIVISLTEKGIRACRDIERRFDGHFAAVLDRIPPDRRDQVVDSVAVLAEAVRAENESSGCCPGRK